MLASPALEIPLPANAPTPAELVQAHGPLVFRAAFRVLGDAALAEDVQQDVFLRMLESPPRDVESWPAWLAAAAVRAAIDVLRSRARWWRRLPVFVATQPTAAPSAEHAGIDAERAARLRTALASLSAREGQCFALRYLQGMDIEEIATTLDLEANAVNVSLHRARKRLGARLAEPQEDGP
jgi:RNA polymerase sigma factor (sigma-70 family)